jgi:hypothetical protein
VGLWRPVGVEPPHEPFESTDLKISASPDYLQKGWIIERARADFGAWHAGLSMEIFGSI